MDDLAIMYELYFRDETFLPMVLFTRKSEKFQLFLKKRDDIASLTKIRRSFAGNDEWKLVWTGSSFDDLLAQPLLLEHTSILVEHLV